LQLPEDTNCKNYNVYLKFNRENNSVDYCFFSEQEKKVIRGTLYYDKAAYTKDARCLSPGVYSSPPRIIAEQILAIYENHNLFYKNEPSPYSANRSTPMSQACLFSLFCSSAIGESHFTYETTPSNDLTVVSSHPKFNCP
jgi:hypothetical protein